jgi:hypothetical protein
VPNWTTSRNYKSIWNSIDDSVTIGMFVTRRPHGAKPEVKGVEWSASWPHFSRFKPKLDGYTPKSVYKSILGPKVSGD